MAKTKTDIRSLARSHTRSAINTLKGIMNEKKAPAAARVAAANSILERGWGKAAQPVTGEDGEGPAIVEIIRRIVDEPAEQAKPRHTNGEDLSASA